MCDTLRAASRTTRPACAAHRIADLGPFKLLDVSATRDEAGKTVTLGIVNRHQDDADHDHRRACGGATIAAVRVYEVNGDDPAVRNSFDAGRTR